MIRANTKILTPRFTLRPFRKSDLRSMVKHINDRSIAGNTLTIPNPYTLKDAEDWFRRFRNIMRRKKPGRMAFAIEIDNEVVGSVGLSIHDHKAEIGYWLGRAYWGQGIMTDVVKETTKYAFNILELRRIYACVFPNNKGSMRVLEKAGYSFEGILRKNVQKGNKLIDEYLFAKVR
jgi:[ribosomal protein S5]-alanine N-acetyltransferase